jgi:uncharacterized protein YndB with AHSA1/START domain
MRLFPVVFGLLLSVAVDDRPAPDEPPSPIDLRVDMPSAPGRVWSALTDPSIVAEWLTTASPIGRIGDPYRLDFDDDSVIDGVIMKLEPGRQFSYTWSWAGSEPHEETLVAWSVTPRPDGGTELRLVHDGWAEAGLDGSARDDHERYWMGYLEDLVAVLAGAG